MPLKRSMKNVFHSKQIKRIMFSNAEEKFPTDQKPLRPLQIVRMY
jgi:hypothetical protein